MKPARKFRVTKQREVILDELRKVVSHPTADEVYRMVRKRLPRVSLGTVYRNLEILSQNGLLLKLEMAGTQRRYDATTANHYHVRCTSCGRVVDLRMDPLPGVERRIGDACGFTITGHRLEFEGLCPRCGRRN
ncbi:MAG: transcriptional repressor [bacterium]|nr:transcriptional repressor [bacterium]